MILPTHPVRRPVAGLVVALLACVATAARAQDKPAATYDSWPALESAEELRAYKNQLREGTFDEAAKAFLTKTALPQLGLPKNRPTIDRVRRKLRDSLCGDDATDAKTAAAAMQTVTAVMIAAARDAKADMTIRVNAALLVGELRGPGGKPWTPAAEPLAKVLGDASLPAAVRIAAAAGLARHVEADPAARASDVGPALLATGAQAAAGVDPVAAAWLRSRALVMLARMGAAAPAGTTAAAAGVLRDAAAPVDLRVRAAATTGACIAAPGDTDVDAAVAAIRDVATAALDDTRAELDRQATAARIGGGQPAPRPDAGLDGNDADAGTPQRFRREAWRLATLADALAPATGDGGLARQAGANMGAATDLAEALRQAAVRLDSQPDADALAAAIEDLAAFAAAPGALPTASPAAPEKAEATPPAAAPAAGASPFGD